MQTSNLDDINKLCLEYDLIQQKTSKLSRMERDKICRVVSGLVKSGVIKPKENGKKQSK
jgi:hypothetical protein